MSDVDARLRRLEDQLAIYQLVCGYGYTVDGCNPIALGEIFAEDGEYIVNDVGVFEGRAAVQGIIRQPQHLAVVASGVAHMSTLPYVVVDGDRAVATCHTMVSQHDGQSRFYISRLSASRVELERAAEGAWQITRRTNQVLNGDERGPDLLGRLTHGPEPKPV